MPSFFCIPLACNRQIDSLDRRQNNLQAVPHDIDRYRGLEELLLAMNHIKELPKVWHVCSNGLLMRIFNV
ncbi:hypothetical protein ANCCAN_30124 [Ancylostoma caninum]|uniref:Leucine Rich repeat-containing domain protein n=1 Tax=Ancylostoma caninum TaxID=29170 RepID=A0A368EWY3_ANCCA|nr:hypothetical protein ANCCAN_30124 [Ancylostoma caninum]